jgi:hypothetical protein
MYIACNHIVWRENEDMLVLLNVSNGHYYTVNKTGSLLWKYLVDGQMNQDEAIKQLSVNFGNVPDMQTVKADCLQMLEQWKSEGLIQESPK